MVKSEHGETICDQGPDRTEMGWHQTSKNEMLPRDVVLPLLVMWEAAGRRTGKARKSRHRGSSEKIEANEQGQVYYGKVWCGKVHTHQNQYYSCKVQGHMYSEGHTREIDLAGRSSYTCTERLTARLILGYVCRVLDWNLFVDCFYPFKPQQESTITNLSNKPLVLCCFLHCSSKSFQCLPLSYRVKF